MRYSEERKREVLAKLGPPHNKDIRVLAEEEGISLPTLYAWKKVARGMGELLPIGSSTGDWTTRDKFICVVETAPMNATQRSEYCRKRGIFIEHLAAWRKACEKANDWAQEREKQQSDVDRERQHRIRVLERDLRRKEKALAETAALLTLSKKGRAIWGGDEDE